MPGLPLRSALRALMSVCEWGYADSEDFTHDMLIPAQARPFLAGDFFVDSNDPYYT